MRISPLIRWPNLLCHYNHEGHTILRKKLTRAKFVQFVIQLEPCLIGMEACSSSHYFARLFTRYGH
ncbi:TPA: transposase, partial [Klebsiella pneumoniae]|nr:transposase [Klebsiella pneumoniae]